MFLRTKDTRAPLALDGAEAQRVRALIEAGHGRPKILDTLRSEGFDVSERQIRTLYDHLRSERRETRAALQEQVVERARLELAGVTPAATAPVLSEDDAAKILAEEFGDTGALKRDDAAAELH